MKKVLTIKDLTIQIKKRQLLKDASFDIYEGDVVLLSGANGVGKSTLLKSLLQLEMQEKVINGEILYKDKIQVLGLEGESLQNFRSQIAYIQQKDEYSEMGNVQVRDIISDSSYAFSGNSLSESEVNELIDEWIPRKDDGRRVFDAKSKPGKFSGGEQRLLSVLSIVATRSNADLLIIDEPLNNLDFVNARNISNVINRLIKQNLRIAILMISHCRIFPFITRELKLTADGIEEVQVPYSCHSCFGEHNEDGYY